MTALLLGSAARARRGAACGRVASPTTASSVELLEPAYGVAPGQAVVIYDGTRVVGSATIAAAGRRTAV